MKELSIEEKAKAYDKAIEELRGLLEGIHEEKCEIMEEDIIKIFPELKESEDERIRKALVELVHDTTGDSLWVDYNVHKEDALAWLEKQGEQKQELLTKEKALKNSPFVEQKPAVPKFRIGDKVKKGYLTYTVEDIDEDSYKLQAYSKDGDKGCTVFLSIGYEKDYELVEQKPADLPKGEDYGIDGLYAAIDILQKTLGEVDGYQSDDGILTHKCAISAVKELSKQKPAWSEEDETALGDALWCCKQAASIAKDENDMGNIWYAERWLKSLRHRSQWRPSDEQIEAVRLAAEIGTANNSWAMSVLESMYQDLKKLREE